MPSKKDAFYFSHDSNARHDPKLGALRAKYGWAGYGLYWAVIEVLRDQPNYIYPSNLLYGLPLAIGYDPNNPTGEGIIFDEFLQDLISFGLLKQENNTIFSDSLINRMDALSAYRERLSESGKRGAEIRWGGHRGANATTIAVKESKGKESKDTQPQVLEFLEYFNQKTGKNLSLTDARKKIINDALKFNSINKLKQAVDNFSKDEWPDRRKYMDIIYCIGTIRGINNLDKWATEQPKNAWVKP